MLLFLRQVKRACIIHLRASISVLIISALVKLIEKLVSSMELSRKVRDAHPCTCELFP